MNDRMTAEKTEAIVLRVVSWSETSVIVTLFSREHGKISALAKGARRPKSPFEAALDLLCRCRIVFLPKSGDVLDLLTEAKLVRRFRNRSKRLLNLYAAYYVAELLRELTDHEDPVPLLYDLADETLRLLEENDCQADAVLLRFELQMLRMLGHQPSMGRCVGCDQLMSENAPIYFGVLVSGVLCERCVSGQRQVIRMTRECRDLYARMVDDAGTGLPVEAIPGSIRGECRGIIQRYLTVHFDRRWQLHRYLEDLAR